LRLVYIGVRGRNLRNVIRNLESVKWDPESVSVIRYPLSVPVSVYLTQPAQTPGPGALELHSGRKSRKVSSVRRDVRQEKGPLLFLTTFPGIPAPGALERKLETGNWNLETGICHPASVIRHPASVIRQPARNPGKTSR